MPSERPGRLGRGGGRIARVLAGYGLAAVLVACAPGLQLPPRPAPHTLPPGSPLASRTLGDGDAWLRHYVMTGDYDAALELIERSKALPGDPLLRRLQAGVVLHAARRYAESNAAFEWAEREADLRYTRSVSRAAASILVNDRVLAYLPTPAERAAIPYYRMLNYLALGDLDAAAVEARKASVLTDAAAVADEPACDASGFLGYFSGLVYRAARETNDALVAFRRAERVYAACAADGAGPAVPALLGADLARAARALGLVELAAADSALPAALPADDDLDLGDVVVVVEEGFAAHRAQQDLFVPLLAADTVGFGAGGNALERAAWRIGSGLSESAAHPAGQGRGEDVRLCYWDRRGDVAHVLKFAWPVTRLEANRARHVRLTLGDSVFEVPPALDLSALLARDLEAQRLAIAARAVARGLAKYALVQQVEEKGGEVAGFLAGLLANTTANLLERADTRSWTLLPDRISLLRLRLPPGEHHLHLAVSPQGGTGASEALDLGTIHVAPGETVFLRRRVW